MRLLTTAIAAASLLAAVASAGAHEYKAGDLEIGHPWSRATLPNAPVAGGYMSITNKGSAPDRLLGGSTPAAASVEVHEMTMEGDVMKMRPLKDGLEIKPGETMTLTPGRFHLMLMKPNKPFKEGDRVPLTLTFEKAGKVKVELAVDKPNAKGPEGGQGAMGDMKHEAGK